MSSRGIRSLNSFQALKLHKQFSLNSSLQQQELNSLERLSTELPSGPSLLGGGCLFKPIGREQR